MTKPINPTTVWIRHISRCASGDAGAVQVGQVHFKANERAGVNGTNGWIQAERVAALSDDGSLSIRFPNAAGGDGVLHRKRFAILTDDSYRLGEEWLEVWRDVDELLGVYTPSTYSIGSGITIECVDPLALTTLTREDALHVWNASPRDVIDYYTRLEMAIVEGDFRGLDAVTGPAYLTANGFTLTGSGAGSVTFNSAGMRFGVTAGAGGAQTLLTAVGSPTGANVAWTFEVEGPTIEQNVGGGVTFGVRIDTIPIELYPLDSNVSIDGELIACPTLLRKKPWSVRVVRRGRWMSIYVQGILLQTRLAPTFAGSVSASVRATTSAGSGDMVARIGSVRFSSMETFLADPTSGDRNLPGAPASGGLRANYYAEPDAKSRSAGVAATWEALCLKPALEPIVTRIDETLNVAAANPPTFQPASVGTAWFTARWIGSIYLDLAAADRNIRFTGGAQNRTQIWVGKTDPTTAPYISGTGAQTGASLRTHLGVQKAGWYPIVIETDVRSGSAGVILEDRAGAGSYSVVSTDRLSPYGIYSESVQRESHRAMIAQVTEAFGYQWIVDPRSLESGQFPGRLIPRVREGRDTNKTIESDSATDVQVNGSAVDSCDRLVIDAAGIPSKEGATGMHVEVSKVPAGKHLFLSTSYDQATEITSEDLLRQRADSLLALRTGPFEQIQVGGEGQRELVDSWPLTGTLALLRWNPGDAARLNLPEVGLVDTSPRQMTGVTWSHKPDDMGAPSVTWRQRTRGARDLLMRALRSSQRTRRTYQGHLTEINGSVGANPTADSPTTMSVLFLPQGVQLVSLELRVVTISGTGTATIEVNSASTGQVIAGESPINVTRFGQPLGATDQRVVARLINVTNRLVEIQLSAVVMR